MLTPKFQSKTGLKHLPVENQDHLLLTNGLIRFFSRWSSTKIPKVFCKRCNICFMVPFFFFYNFLKLGSSPPPCHRRHTLWALETCSQPDITFVSFFNPSLSMWLAFTEPPSVFLTLLPFSISSPVCQKQPFPGWFFRLVFLRKWLNMNLTSCLATRSSAYGSDSCRWGD